MVIVVVRIFLCMAVIFQARQRTHESFLLSCRTSAHSSFITTRDLETKNLKSQRLEWLYLMNLNNIQLFTRLSHLSAETM